MDYRTLQQKLTNCQNALDRTGITREQADSVLCKATGLETAPTYQNIVNNALADNEIRPSDDFGAEADQFSEEEINYVDNDPLHFYDYLDPINEDVDANKMYNAVSDIKQSLTAECN